MVAEVKNSPQRFEFAQVVGDSVPTDWRPASRRMPIKLARTNRLDSAMCGATPGHVDEVAAQQLQAQIEQVHDHDPRASTRRCRWPCSAPRGRNTFMVNSGASTREDIDSTLAAALRYTAARPAPACPRTSGASRACVPTLCRPRSAARARRDGHGRRIVPPVRRAATMRSMPAPVTDVRSLSLRAVRRQAPRLLQQQHGGKIQLGEPLQPRLHHARVVAGALRARHEHLGRQARPLRTAVRRAGHRMWAGWRTGPRHLRPGIRPAASPETGMAEMLMACPRRRSTT